MGNVFSTEIKESLLAHLMFGFIASLKGNYSEENVNNKYLNLSHVDKMCLRKKIKAEIESQRIFSKIKNQCLAVNPLIGKNDLLYKLETIHGII